MKKMIFGKKNRLFLLLLLTVFFVGVSGRLLCKAPPRETAAFLLTVRSSAEDALVLSHLSTEPTDATLDGIPAKISLLTVRAAERTRVLPSGGVTQYRSQLFSEVEITLLLEGELREGRLFANGLYLPLGKRAVLESPNFIITVGVMEIKTA